MSWGPSAGTRVNPVNQYDDDGEDCDSVLVMMKIYFQSDLDELREDVMI